jgi:hypothetical protein
MYTREGSTGMMEFHNYGFNYKKFKVLFAVRMLLAFPWGSSSI